MSRLISNLMTACCLLVFCTACVEEGPVPSAGAPPQSKPIQAKAVQPVSPAAIAKVAEPADKKFTYIVEGRRDPFTPLTTIKKRVKSSNQPLTPLQRFDLGAFELKAVLLGMGVPRAIVDAPDGKAYILKKGIKIGKNEGIVVEIDKEKVLVEEKYYDFSGEVRSNVLEISLPKREGV